MSDAPLNSSLPGKIDVLIAGAGPVGMLLALLLARRKISSLLIEPRTEIHPHSRAIGIHPPGLDALERAGVHTSFLDQGVMVPGGSVYVEDQCYGHLEFAQNPGKWKYPLLLPQHRTETLLEEACRAEPLVHLHRRWRVEDLELISKGNSIDKEKSIVKSIVKDIAKGIREGHSKSIIGGTSEGYLVRCVGPQGSQTIIETRFLVGCDGKRSRVRELLNITWIGNHYRDQYLLGDVKDDTDFGKRAVIFLTRQGLVESFPLQEGWRRWVVHIDEETLPASLKGEQSSWITTELSDWHKLMQVMIQSRTGHQVDVFGFGVLGSFGIERRLAKNVYQGNAFLAGDAAHIVSPIGGQGMNLGWMDAVNLADTIDRLRRTTNISESKLIKDRYEHIVLRRARKGIRRAWFNTIWGRSRIPRFVRKGLVNSILTEPLRSYFTRQFTMTNLR